MLRRVFLNFIVGKKAAPSNLSRTASREALCGQANLYFDSGEYAKAVSAYLSALKFESTPEINVNLAYSYFALQNYSEAELYFRKALQQSATFAPALTGLGDILSKQQRYEESIELYDRALESNPNLASAHNNRSLSLTAVGRLEEAWVDAEWRYLLPETNFLYPHKYKSACWDGKSLSGKRLLIHWEQGYGDIIQHLRFIPLVKTTDNTILFECPSALKRLSSGVTAIDEVIEAENKPVSESTFDFYVPLLSLPYMLKVDKGSIPTAPYLFAPKGSELSLQYLKRSRRFLIGIVWKASSTDLRRNCALSDLFELSGADTQLISLQKSVTPNEAAELAEHKIIDAGAKCYDFADTAAVIASLDLIISVDTSVAHLAGALGKPVLLLLNEPAAERWMMNSEKSLWYPTMRVFRKRTDEAWQLLIKKIKKVSASDIAIIRR